MGAGGDALGAIVEGNAYMTLATADADGNPWATPVWFAHVDCAEFLWVSRPEARHSRNIAARPAIGIVVFDSTARPLEGEAAYFDAVAAEVPADERGAALAAYSARSTAAGLKSWTEADVTAPAEHRLYLARVTSASLLDGGDARTPVL